MNYAPALNIHELRRSRLFLPFVLAFYLAAPLYPIPLIGVSLSLPLVFILAFKNGKIRLPHGTPFTSFLLILIAALTLSLMVNVMSGDLNKDIDASILYILQFCVYVIAAILGYNLFLLPEFPKLAAIAFALGVAVMSAFIVLENITLGSVISNGGWSRITRMSQNSYAVQFSCYLPFIYYSVLASGRKFNRMRWFFIGSFCLVAVMANGSRTAWITTILTMLIFLSSYALLLRKYNVVIFSALLIPIILFAGWIILPESLKNNLIKDFDTYENLEGDKSWMIRQLQIQKSMKIFKDSPWFGVGPAQFRNQLIGLDMPDVLAGRSSTQFSQVSAHNSYIQFLSEAGLVFMVPFALFIGWLLLAGLRASIFLAREGEVWTLSLYSGLVALSIHFWTIAGLTSTGPWFLYGAVAATITRAKFLKRKTELIRQASLRKLRCG